MLTYAISQLFLHINKSINMISMAD